MLKDTQQAMDPEDSYSSISRKLSAVSEYRCNWIGCPETFKNPSLLRAHVIGVHFEPDTFAAECRVSGGRWKDWQSIHGTRNSPYTGSRVAAIPPSHPSTPRTRRSLSGAPAEGSPGGGPVPSSPSKPEILSHLATPEQPDRGFPSTSSFIGFGALDTPLRANHLDDAEYNSPTLSVLVRRSHGSSLPASPQLRAPSPSTSSEGPKKRRRVSADAETSSELDGSSLLNAQNGEEYDPEADESFPEFLLSDDANLAKLLRPEIHSGFNKSTRSDTSLIQSHASSVDVEYQLTQPGHSRVNSQDRSPGAHNEPPDGTKDASHEQVRQKPTSNDFSSEPEPPTQNRIDVESPDEFQRKLAQSRGGRNASAEDAPQQAVPSSTPASSPRHHSAPCLTTPPSVAQFAAECHTPCAVHGDRSKQTITRRSTRLRSGSSSAALTQVSKKPISGSKPQPRTRSTSVTSLAGGNTNRRRKQLERRSIEPIKEDESDVLLASEERAASKTSAY
ncbi:hypothetical protein BDY19DRAFT_992293 [Irpex rosettiformis]|uniref:Uncharacterized protein n=1 Tax=Irpex rosettiformis TaxID=378272 RepID=A0ACB8U9V7_9APHY|nr:hypothetical protein BDY19DRAFT_992293 [Irpex rosettiformis]